MTTIPLDTAASATFVDNGNGSSVATVQLGPAVYASTWHVRNTLITTNSTQQQFGVSTFTLYRMNQSPSSMIDGSYSGDQDTSDTAYSLSFGQTVIGVWSGGDIGAIATLTLSGTVETGRRR